MWELVPLLGIEPSTPALGTWSLNHWDAREVFKATFLPLPSHVFTPHLEYSAPSGVAENLHRASCLSDFIQVFDSEARVRQYAGAPFITTSFLTAPVI